MYKDAESHGLGRFGAMKWGGNMVVVVLKSDDGIGKHFVNF